MFTDDDRIGRLNAAYKDLLKSRSVMLHETVKLGYPRFVNELLDTAAVSETEDGRIMYYWNRAFFDSLSVSDRIYVCTHEALHIILGHPLRRKDRDPKRWNYACDIAVNTALDHAFYLRLEKHTKLHNRWMAKHVNKQPYEVMKLTAEEIYDLLPAHISFGLDLDSHEFWDSLTEDQIRNVHRQLEKHAKGRGMGSTGELVLLQKMLTRPFPWQKLLQGRLATVKRPKEGESWVRCNRKIYQYYPQVLLPGVHDSDGDTSNILTSIDTSGSMAQEEIEDLVAITRSLPKEDYKTHLTWFDDGVYDAPDLTKVQGRGGTCFQKIEQVCTGELPIKGADGKEVFISKYPDIVVVMTDGGAPTPTLKHPERWIWILTPGGYDYAIRNLGSTIWRVGPA